MKLTDCIGMRGRMVMLITAAMLPLAGFIGVSIDSEYRQTLARARLDVMQAASLAATRQSQLFATSRSLLDTVRRSPDVSVAGGADCEQVLARIKDANPQFLSLGVTDAHGVITCHDTLRERKEFTDPTLVQRIMVDGAPNFIVGNFMIGKVTKKETIALAMPMRDLLGKKVGMVFGSLDLDRLSRMAEEGSVGGRRSLAIIQPASARVLTHFPEAPFAPGTIFGEHPLISAMRGAPAGGVTEAEGFLHDDRIFGFAPIEGAETSGLMLAVGESRDFLLAPVHAHAMRSIAAGATAMILALATAWWLGNLLQLRPVVRLTEVAKRIGTGDFSARANLSPWQAPELRSLSETLDRMAVHLAAGREAERAVAESEARYRLLAENTADIVSRIDLHGRRSYVSPASRELLGIEPDVLVGELMYDICHPDDRSIVEELLAQLRAGLAVQGVQHRKRRSDGRYVWVEVSGRPIGDGESILVIRDVDERRRMEDDLAEANRRLASLASTDALTGLLNRRAFDQALEQSFDAATAGGLDLALLMIDVDRFKTFNDRYGHTFGDDCLRQVAQTFRATLALPDAATARYGGEEFAVIMPKTSLSLALEAAERLRRAIRDLAIENATSEHGVITVSIGAAILSGGQGLASTLDLVRRADTALYYAKASGRDRTEIGLSPLAEAS